MIRNILVPLDGSARAERSVSHAEAVAVLSEAVIVLLRVVEADEPAAGPAVDPVHFRFAQQRAAEYLQSLAARLTSAGLRSRWEVTVGKPAEQIVDFARLNDIDVIVLATHGRGDATGFGFGGTAHKVMERAGVSVMLVPSADPVPAAPGRMTYRRIVVPVDRSPRADWAVSFAAAIARASDGELILVHVIPVFEVASLSPGGTEEQRLADALTQATRERAERNLREAVAQLEDTGISARYRIAESPHAATTISDIVVQEGADLTLLVAHGSAGETRLPYGSVCAKLLAMGSGVTLVLQDQPHGSRAVSPVEPSPPPRGLAARP